MSLTLLLVWIVLLGVALASYLWLSITVLRSTVPAREKWSLLLPPLGCIFALRQGPLPRVLSILAVMSSIAYLVARAWPH